MIMEPEYKGKPIKHFVFPSDGGIGNVINNMDFSICKDENVHIIPFNYIIPLESRRAYYYEELIEKAGSAIRDWVFEAYHLADVALHTKPTTT